MIFITTWLLTVGAGYLLGSLTHSKIGLFAPLAVFCLYWGRRALIEWKQTNQGE